MQNTSSKLTEEIADRSRSALKILGAAAGAGHSYDECFSLGKAVNAQCVGIAATLDHCHVPGRTEAFQLSPDEIELGTGPHNEPVSNVYTHRREVTK